MFRWKKRDDGFEWHQYVRTTIKLRREVRRDKAQKLGQQAAEGAKAASVAAGVAAGNGVRGLGSLAHAVVGTSRRLATSGFGLASRSLGNLGRALGIVLSPVLHVIGRPGISGPLVFIGCLATAAGLGRLGLAGRGLDVEALTALMTGLLCLAGGFGPSLWLGHSVLPTYIGQLFAALGLHARVAAGLIVALAVAGAALLTAGQFGVGLPTLASLPTLPFTGAAATKIEGRANLVATDLLRVGDSTVRLAGIEPPDRDQRCTRAAGGANAKTWPCGEEARDAASRLVRAQVLKCETSDKDASGVVTGRCHAGTIDIAEALVRGGHVFAEAGVLSTYRAAEGAAKTAKSGLWSSSVEPERPATWRARMWAEAKQQAPEGCPIKGRVARGERIYVLPWSTEYPKARISKQRGERWFCTEAEAVAAGWRVAGRG